MEKQQKSVSRRKKWRESRRRRGRRRFGMSLLGRCEAHGNCLEDSSYFASIRCYSLSISPSILYQMIYGTLFIL